MKLRRIDYSELTAKQKEIYNFQKVASELADFGFNCIKLSDDWQGADFLAYHKDGKETLKVQLKSRVSVYQKYLGKELYLAFPVDDTWYLIEHDKLVELVRENTNWLETESWCERGGYSAARPNRALFDALQESRL
ncbi:hypothetical protein [Natronospira bacteriovora]|uniref:PD(D/E)XK endonuclease domain-containing protein n=1 Tax=Natronospira bacteriovora TaxID=3069753 RepID=A0ABU0W9I3_9GAMM|nr:hypothetical protein [Natronospira sp. AB-CW4]MDQ2070656.1 hypothetical protein [Natronospira sp. AB-CW4]